MRKLFIFTLILIAISMATSNAQSANTLTPHKAEYKVKISVVSGELKTDLRQTTDGYIARHVIEPTGMSRVFTRGKMDVTSSFSVNKTGVYPVSYQAVDTIGDDPDVDLDFDWQSKTARGTVGEQAVEFEFADIVHDSVSIQYQLMHDLQSGVSNEHYLLFDVDKMRQANVSLAGSRSIKLKLGTFDAVGVRHQKDGSSRVTTLWCVEELGFLPVIIEQHRKGKLNFRATLVSYTPTRT